MKTACGKNSTFKITTQHLKDHTRGNMPFNHSSLQWLERRTLRTILRENIWPSIFVHPYSLQLKKNFRNSNYLAHFIIYRPGKECLSLSLSRWELFQDRISFFKRKLKFIPNYKIKMTRFEGMWYPHDDIWETDERFCIHILFLISQFSQSFTQLWTFVYMYL
jgi:hypothetical protein